MEEHPDERAVARYSRAEELFRANGGYAAESEARAIAAGLGLDAPRQDLPDRRALRRRAAPRRDRPHPLRRQRRAAPRRADQPPRRRRQGVAARLPARLPRRPARDQPRPRAARRGDHPRAPPRPPRRGGRRARSSSTAAPTRSTCAPAPRTSAAPPRSPPGRARRSPGCRPSSIASAPRRRRRRWRTASRSASPASRRTASRSASGDRTLRVRFPAPPAAGRTVVEAVGLTKSYGGPDIFADVSFDLGRGERLLVLGLNGAGKTTLLRILAGETAADRGTFQFGHNVTAGYYAQEHDNLRVGETLLDNIRAEVPPGITLTETELRGLLGMFGLSGDKVFQEAGTLSGGEKTKLALAMLMVGRNNLLLLDEPTNNLDPSSRIAVADAAQRLAGLDHLRQPRHRVRRAARPDEGAADARRRRRLLRRRLARARRPRLDAAGRRCGRSRRGQAVAHSPGGDFGAARHPQLGEDVGDVHGRGPRRDVQPPSELGVAQSFGQQGGDLAFASVSAHRRRRRRRRGGCSRASASSRRQPGHRSRSGLAAAACCRASAVRLWAAKARARARCSDGRRGCGHLEPLACARSGSSSRRAMTAAWSALCAGDERSAPAMS